MLAKIKSIETPSTGNPDGMACFTASSRDKDGNIRKGSCVFFTHEDIEELDIKVGDAVYID